MNCTKNFHEYADNFVRTSIAIATCDACDGCKTPCHEQVEVADVCIQCILRKNVGSYLMKTSVSSNDNFVKLIQLMKDESTGQLHYTISKDIIRIKSIIDECNKSSSTLSIILELAGKDNIHPIKYGQYLRTNRDEKVRICYLGETNTYDHISADILYVHGSSGSIDCFELQDSTDACMFRHVNYITSDGNVYTSFHGYNGVSIEKHYEAYCKLKEIYR